jgi:hypothetical protein
MDPIVKDHKQKYPDGENEQSPERWKIDLAWWLKDFLSEVFR